MYSSLYYLPVYSTLFFFPMYSFAHFFYCTLLLGSFLCTLFFIFSVYFSPHWFLSFLWREMIRYPSSTHKPPDYRKNGYRIRKQNRRSKFEFSTRLRFTSRVGKGMNLPFLSLSIENIKTNLFISLVWVRLLIKTETSDFKQVLIRLKIDLVSRLAIGVGKWWIHTHGQ